MNYMVRPKRNGASYTFFNDFDAVLNNLFNRDQASGQRLPLVDVKETEDGYTVEAELPGFSEEEIDVRVEDKVLSITARKGIEEKQEKESQKEDKFLLKERTLESFHRRFSLPGDVDVEQINGNYKNGVLSLSIAKKAETKPRSIKVKAA